MFIHPWPEIMGLEVGRVTSTDYNCEWNAPCHVSACKKCVRGHFHYMVRSFCVWMGACGMSVCGWVLVECLCVDGCL